MSGGGLAGGITPILFIVIIGVVIFAIYKKKKNDREANPFLSNRKNKDEVWKTIKQFLKDQDEQGKEIVDSYVVKRNHRDYIDPNGSNLDKKNKNYELKIRRMQLKQARKLEKKQGIKAPKQKVNRDLFVVVFQTKDSKTGRTDPYRCFECEVVNTKIAKKQYDRKILIHGQLDYDKEMEWIAPVRAAEVAKSKAMQAKLDKQKAAQAKREKKRRIREEKRARKHAKN